MSKKLCLKKKSLQLFLHSPVSRHIYIYIYDLHPSAWQTVSVEGCPANTQLWDLMECNFQEKPPESLSSVVGIGKHTKQAESPWPFSALKKGWVLTVLSNNETAQRKPERDLKSLQLQMFGPHVGLELSTYRWEKWGFLKESVTMSLGKMNSRVFSVIQRYIKCIVWSGVKSGWQKGDIAQLSSCTKQDMDLVLPGSLF